MTWQEDLERRDRRLWYDIKGDATEIDDEGNERRLNPVDLEGSARMTLENTLDRSGYMWSISRMWYPNSQPYKIMIFIDPDHIIEIYEKSRIEALVAGWLALKRAKP